MVSDSKDGGKGKKRKHPQYLPYNKPVKKGHYAVRPGVEGFFITCDGGRESQAKHEAILLFDRFYEELLQEKGVHLVSKTETETAPVPGPKRIVFNSDDEGSSSDDEDENNANNDSESKINNGSKDGDDKVENECKSTENAGGQAVENESCGQDSEGKDIGSLKGESSKNGENPEQVTEDKQIEHQVSSDEVQGPAKKARVEMIEDKGKAGNPSGEYVSIDSLMEAELEELGNKEKATFLSLDSGCNGVIFIRMHRDTGCPGPSELVEYMMNKAASTRKHMSRFILRILPVEVTCYASAEEIEKAAKQFIDNYFPSAEGQTSIKFAVLYDARANTGIDRMKIIDTVAKMVPKPHKVDLKNPDKTIIVQIVKTICMIGVVHKYKEYSKYNLRQLTGMNKKS